MNTRKLSTLFLVPVLCLTMAVQSCADKVLPYIQLGSTMAVQILQLVSAFQGQQVSPADIAAIQTYSQNAQKIWGDINLALTAYDTNKTQGTLAALTAALQSGYNSLPELLTNLHIVNPQLQARIEAAALAMIDVISTIAAFKGITVTPVANARLRARIPAQARKSVKDLKNEWNQNVAQGSPAVVIP